jgi:hypothetical protein
MGSQQSSFGNSRNVKTVFCGCSSSTPYEEVIRYEAAIDLEPLQGGIQPDVRPSDADHQAIGSPRDGVTAEPPHPHQPASSAPEDSKAEPMGSTFASSQSEKSASIDFLLDDQAPIGEWDQFTQANLDYSKSPP